MRLEDLSPSQLALVQAYAKKKQALEDFQRTNKILRMYPDDGEFRRSLYPKHLDFFNAHARQVLFTAGNRCGKTIAGSYQTALHLTGDYPDWWQGRRFESATQVCCAGDTNESTRDIIQKELFGEVEGIKNGKRWVSGTGMIPLDRIEEIFWKSGVQNMIDYALIRHADGGLSRVVLKTYAQGRKLFQGTAYHVVWFDEEPPADVYIEAITRTATTGGMAYLTFTPLQGVSDTIQLFLPEGHVTEYNDGVRAVVNMTWDDAPHLDEKTKQELVASFPPHLRDARTKGLPSLGSGAVFPISEENILVDDFPLPIYWPRAYGMDVGWNWNAAVFGAWDTDSETMYIYSEIKMGHVEPETFAAAIKARAGDWMQGAIDPASQGSNQFDGRKLMDEYRGLGLKLTPANNAVEAQLFAMYQAMLQGRFKVFRSCTNWLKEFRLYQRDEKGRIKKENDHCFHGDTQVITDKGLSKIKDMVGSTGKVLSLNGQWMPYKDCKMTRKNAELIELEFEDGYSVKCTPDHKFLTVDGWTQAIDLLGKECYHNVPKTIQEEGTLCKLLSYQKSNSNSKEKLTGNVANISKGMEKGFIEKSGKYSTTKNKFLKVIMSIIKTGVNQTTNQKILSLLHVLTTWFTITRERKDLSQKMHLWQQQFGTNRAVAKIGIKNITRTLNTCFTGKFKGIALTAGTPMRRRRLKEIPSAITSANRHLEERQSLTMSQNHALFAKSLLTPTNTTIECSVQGHVLLRCVSAKKTSNSDVYCLNVPVSHAFSLANGAIVHNCTDSSRYLFGTGALIKTINPEAYRDKFGRNHKPKNVITDFDVLD